MSRIDGKHKHLDAPMGMHTKGQVLLCCSDLRDETGGASAFSLHNLPFVATQPMEAQQYLSFLMVVPYLTIYIVTRPADGVKRKAYGSPMRSWRYLALSRENECAGP